MQLFSPFRSGLSCWPIGIDGIMRATFFVFLVSSCISTALAQFESLSDKESAKDKLDDYFVQADTFVDSFAVGFRAQTVLFNESTGVTKELSSSGMTVKSSKQRLKYFCYEYDGVFNPPIPWRSESLLFRGLERRRSYSIETRNRPMKKAETIEPDPLTGLRAESKSEDYFSDLGQEIDPYGLVMSVSRPTTGRNSELERVLKTWVTRLELKSETETKGLLLSKWNGFGREENAVGRREIIFDSRCGYLPTSVRVFLVDQAGKQVINGVKTSWEKYKSGQWRPLQSVVSYTHGPDRIEETFEFAWAEPEELELFLSKQDFNAVVKDDYSDWYKLFAGFLGSQQVNKDKKTK